MSNTLKNVTETLMSKLNNMIDKDFCYLNLEEYSWVHTIYICRNGDGEHLHEIKVVRQKHDGSFQIGIPDYDMTNYLSTGNFNECFEKTIKQFFEKYNLELHYRNESLKRILKEQSCIDFTNAI